MTSRFNRLETVLLERVSSSGGWPHWLHLADASTSLVGTAHALAMLRMRGYEAHDPIIENGLRYLAREVKVHTKPGRRGEYSRYPAYALWGLMRFPAGLADEKIVDGARFSATWLIRRARPSGGWSVEGRPSDDGAISLPATMAAVYGLDRLPPYVRGSLAARCNAASSAARDAVAEHAYGSGTQSYWKQRSGGKACPGATGLAVLTLAGGSPDHRQLAAQGINYLLANPDDWTGSVHLDQHLDQLTWRIMSFSVCLRAVLHPCSGQTPTESVKAAVIEHMDSLWSEKTGAWAVEQGNDASTTGSYAVAAAVRALKNAWEYDPAIEISPRRRAQSKRRSKKKSPASESQRRRRVIEVWEWDRRIRIAEEIGPEQHDFFVRWDEKATSQWPMLVALLRRTEQAAGIPNPNQHDSTLSWAELVEYSNNGAASWPTIERTIDRINEKIRDTAIETRRFPPFQDLIERIVPGDTEEVHFGLEEAEVTFHQDQ